jgi:multiple antibiotic resistance protein
VTAGGVDALWGFAVFAFVSLFTMVNPIGVVPPYLGMTTGMAPTQSRRVARRAVVTATAILALFAITGQWVFSFFGISVDSLRVVGGIIFLLLGYRMLSGRVPRERQGYETHEDYATDISITPLGIPIVCGPGSIATAILLTTEDPSASHTAVTLVVILTIMAITWAIMLSGRRVMAFFGESGTIVLMRLMGLIIMAIAVEFLVAGLTPIVREMLAIGG